MAEETGKEGTQKGFTAEERAAMKERAKELKAEARKAGRGKRRCSRRSPRCRKRIASWPSGSMRSSRPTRRASRRRPGTGCPRTPRDGKVVCFFQSADKFKSRYATFGFSDQANLDNGAMWPTTFALKKLTAADEKKDRRAREKGGELRTKPAQSGHGAAAMTTSAYLASRSSSWPRICSRNREVARSNCPSARAVGLRQGSRVEAHGRDGRRTFPAGCSTNVSAGRK